MQYIKDQHASGIPVCLSSNQTKLTRIGFLDASNTDKLPRGLYVAQPSLSHPHQAQSQTQIATVYPLGDRIAHILRVGRGCKGIESRWGKTNRIPAQGCILGPTRGTLDVYLEWEGVSANSVRPRFLDTSFLGTEEG